MTSQVLTYNTPRTSIITFQPGINKATLLGRVGRDSELRGTEANPVSIFPLATSLTLKTKDGLS